MLSFVFTMPKTPKPPRSPTSPISPKNQLNEDEKEPEENAQGGSTALNSAGRDFFLLAPSPVFTENSELNNYNSSVGNITPVSIYNGTRSVQQIPIYIETLTGTTFEVQILPQKTIGNMKMKLQREEGIPFAQQHIIWQGEELKDNFSLDDYGIGFGAILRLVLSVRSGPLSTNCSETDTPLVDSTDQPEDEDLDENDPHSLRVLIFHNGDEMRVLRIGSGEDDASNLVTPVRSSDERIELKTAEKSEAECVERERQRIKRDIEQENEKMRIKIEDLQRRMNAFSIKRRSKFSHRDQKLPSIINRKKNSALKTRKQLTDVHLPSLFVEEKNAPKPRTGSIKSGSNEINVKKNSLYEWQTKSDESSFCGSLCKKPSIMRPKTTPLMGEVTRIDKNFDQFLKEMKAQKVNVLPPVMHVKKNKERIRCKQCRKRLALANRYECRCGQYFCSIHRYSEMHQCSFDYRAEGRKLIKLNNPLIQASKLPKI